jgi:alanine racemase
MRPSRAIVRLDAIRRNLAAARRFAPASRNIPVIKANAYGHGAVEVARALHNDAPAFAVAVIDEAVELRDAGIENPILVLQGCNHREGVNEAAARRFWLMLHDRGQVEQVIRSRPAAPVTAWLKVDTGMHRLGLSIEEAASARQALSAADHVSDPMVLCTHLACADEPERPMTQIQVSAFRAFAEPLGLPLSIANSAGILHWPETHADWNRPGVMLYGSSPSAKFGNEPGLLQAAMTLQSELIAVREIAAGEGVGYGQRWKAREPARIGTITIGYADGYPRHAPSGTPVLVNGKRVPLVGTVSMDMITVDLSGVGDAKPGDPVELWGENLRVNEVAETSGTIGYELLAGLTRRVPLVYV